MGISFAPESMGKVLAIDIGGETVNNTDATIDTELDRSLVGFPAWVGICILLGDTAATAIIDTLSLHGDNAGTITPSDSNLLATHGAFAAAQTASYDSKFVALYTSNVQNSRYITALISNNVAANLVIDACWWEFGWAGQAPVDPAIGDFLTPSPQFVGSAG